MTKLSSFSHKDIANTIRGLSMDAIQKANSGHPGLPMGMADVASVLWSDFLRFNPANPSWFNRDRFVLSGGHGSMLLYSLLHLYGYDLSLEDIKNFRQLGSKTAGHPEMDVTPGVETTTGPLGQGLANAVGLAIAESHLSKKYSSTNQLIDHHTYVMAGDGDLQEGISHEACSLAGHLGLGKLIVLYDSNDITIDGSTALSYSDDVRKRFESYSWDVKEIDGHNYQEIAGAIAEAKQQSQRPTIIVCKTIIGFGSPNKAGTSGVHGSPLGEAELKLSKAKLGISPEDFHVPVELEALKNAAIEKGQKMEEEWNDAFENLKNSDPKKQALLSDLMNGNFPSAINTIPYFEAEGSMATRKASGKVLEYLTAGLNNLIGGSADLTPSNNTKTKHQTGFSSSDYSGNYIYYGVREHAMGAIMNGISLHGGLIPYGGTFFVFSDYMRPAIRMAALMEQQVIFVLTHDSIGLGEDGPTHQPVEHLSSLRAMPNLKVIRPMDANETLEAWKIALDYTTGPSCIVLTRQGLPIMDVNQFPINLTNKGGYVLAEDPGFDRIIIAAGSEVKLAMEAKLELNKQGYKIRVVSMPCTEAFDAQNAAYRDSVLPSSIVKRLAIEAGASQSWFKYVGLNGKVLGIDTFGASAPQDVLFDHFGITSKALIEATIAL